MAVDTKFFRALLDAMAPGPPVRRWKLTPDGPHLRVNAIDFDRPYLGYESALVWTDPGTSGAVVNFIVEIHNALPEMLDEIDRLRSAEGAMVLVDTDEIVSEWRRENQRLRERIDELEAQKAVLQRIADAVGEADERRRQERE